MAIVTSVTMVNIGERMSLRTTCLSWLFRVPMG